MKTAILILSILSILLLLSTVICGMWIRAQANVEKSSIDFHMNIALAAAGSTLVTLVLALVQVMRTAG